MGFTNPPVLGSAVELLASADGLTPVIGVAGIQSLLIQPSYANPSGGDCATIAVEWFSDPAGPAAQVAIATESHSVFNTDGRQYPVLPVILTQCKAAYVRVSMFGVDALLEPIKVYSSNAQVVGFARLDQLNNKGFPPMLGMTLTTIASGSKQGVDTIDCCAAPVLTRQAICAISAVDTITTTTTLTPTLQVYMPAAIPTPASPNDPTDQGGLYVGEVVATGQTTPTTGGTTYTAPVTLPALPANCPFLVSPILDLAAAVDGELAVTTFVY